jgi:hypothetical protein
VSASSSAQPNKETIGNRNAGSLIAEFWTFDEPCSGDESGEVRPAADPQDELGYLVLVFKPKAHRFRIDDSRTIGYERLRPRCCRVPPRERSKQ